ncbi:glycosyl hydrolase family 5 [Bifidobacterium lemurum]|uniref:Exo-1,3-beta-glucanase D n=2 Tax=Bifidobacterium lemurum TaxID=1603886 RepID=A0A261FU98_9BIFI|nr:glycosyl hydrolase family 5 [Bifidobacterium lemurum]
MVLGCDEKINGVNLGNWLVLERWMSPSLFEESGEDDEIWMHRTMPASRLEEVLREHRDTYVTLADFQAIAARGYNLVRLPVPYFVFGDVSGHPGCIEYVDKAFAWARETGLKVLLDLHTVPGSQNGYDNGGLTGVCRWSRSPRAVEFALSVLTRLAERYRDDPALYGVEVLNEPISWLVYRTAPSTGRAKSMGEAYGSGHVSMRFLKRFYREAYRRLRSVLRPETVIVFHDGFRLNRWGNWFRREGMRRVMLDTHIYIAAMESFVPIHEMWAYRLFVKLNELMIRRAARYVPVVVGEWCIENRWAASCGEAGVVVDDSVDAISERERRMRDAYREVAALQLRAWNVSAGQIYWNYQLVRDVSGGDDCTRRKQVDFEAWDLTRVWRNGWMADRRAGICDRLTLFRE